MAQTIVRTTLTQFGSSGASSYFGQFGSKQAGSPVTTKVIATIQALSAWVNGWQAAVYSSNNAPFLEDMNSIHFLENSYLCYLLQEGIAEYDAGTPYNKGSVVKTPYGSGVLTTAGMFYYYISIIDGNTGNALPSGFANNSAWQCIFGRDAYGGIQMPGTNNNPNAPAGAIGEWIQNYSSGFSLPDLVYTAVNSINLTPGDWDISAIATQAYNSATGGTFFRGGVTTFASGGTGLAPGDNQAETTAAIFNYNSTLSIPSWRVTSNANFTVYFQCYTHYSAGTSFVSSRISARRMR